MKSQVHVNLVFWEKIMDIVREPVHKKPATLRDAPKGLSEGFLAFETCFDPNKFSEGAYFKTSADATKDGKMALVACDGTVVIHRSHELPMAVVRGSLALKKIGERTKASNAQPGEVIKLLFGAMTGKDFLVIKSNSGDSAIPAYALDGESKAHIDLEAPVERFEATLTIPNSPN